MALEYFPCYYSYRKKLAKLSDQEVGRLFRSLLEYGETGETEELTGRESVAFDFIADDIDRAKAAYDEKCSKNKKNVEARYDCMRSNTTEYERKQTKTETKDKDKEKLSKDSKDNARKSAKHTLGEYSNVFLTDEELDKLKAEFPDWEERIERLSSYIASSGKKYKNHLATIRNWARGDESKQQTAPTNHKIGPGAFAIDPVSYDARLRKDMEWLKQFSESEGANG